MATRLLLPLLTVVLLSSGCLEFGALVGQALTDGTGGSFGSDGLLDGQDGDSGGSGGIPVVGLSVSNPTPQLNEQVVLTCTLVSGSAAAVTYAFQGGQGRLIGNAGSGTASLIVDASDAGRQFTITCTATTTAGTSEPSSPQTIIPTS